jgi:rhodanese-related sulfurtransferase
MISFHLKPNFSSKNIAMTATEFFKHKLEFETDSYDVFTAVEAKEKIVVIDARSAEAYEREHLPFAISLPHRKMNAETTAQFDKDASYVTYCDGIGCNASTKGALKMSELGFKTKELLGGLDWWKRDGYATEGTHSMEGVTCGC